MNNKIKPYMCRGYLFCMKELLGKTTTQIANECGVSYPTITYWFRKSNGTIQNRKTCETCGKLIKGRLKGCVLINIFQNPIKHYFCSKTCKVNWIYRRQEINLLNV